MYVYRVLSRGRVKHAVRVVHACRRRRVDVTLLSLTSTSDSVAHKAVVTDLSSNAKAPAPTVHINDSSSEDVDSTSKDSCAPAHHCNTESRMMPGPTNAVQQAAALLNAGAQHHVRNVILDLEKAANHLLPDIGSVPPVPGRSQAKILAHRRVVFHRLSPLRERTFHFINLRCIQFGKS